MEGNRLIKSGIHGFSNFYWSWSGPFQDFLNFVGPSPVRFKNSQHCLVLDQSVLVRGSLNWIRLWSVNFFSIIPLKYYLKFLLEIICKINDLLCDLKIEILKTKNWWVRSFYDFDRSSVSRNIKMNHSDLIGMVLSPTFWNVKMNIIWCGLFQKDFFKFWTDSSLFFVALKLKCSF